MADLLRKPFGSHGQVHEITPQSAGWRFVGLSLYRLRAGGRVDHGAGCKMIKRALPAVVSWRFVSCRC